MKKVFKKAVSIFLIAVMVLVSAPLSGFVGFDWLDFSELFSIKSEATSYSGTCGENLTWTLDTETGVLEISGIGAMTDWIWYNYPPWSSYDSNIKSVEISNNVTNIGAYAFNNCYNLKSIIIPDCITSIGDRAFYSCDKLTSITVPSSVTQIGNEAFYECYSLTSIVLSKGIESIGDLAFYRCGSLSNIVIPSSVTNIGRNPFYCCANLTDITVDSSNTFYSSDEFGVLFNKNKTELIQYPIGNSRGNYDIPNGTITINDYAFAYSNIINVRIPESVTAIGLDVFYWSTKLNNILVDQDNSYYSSDSFGVLYDKNKTKLIQYPVGNLRTNYITPDSVITICENAFYYCDNLISVTISDSVTTIGTCAFSDCSNLKNLIIGKGVVSIGAGAFRWCESLTCVEIPNSVTSIGTYGFSNCYQLTSVILGNGLSKIESGVFYYCHNLSKITIPYSIINIEACAFSECFDLTDLLYTGTQTEWETITIERDNEYLKNATIHFNYIADESKELILNHKSITISNNVCPIINVVEYPQSVTADSLVWSSSNNEVAYVNEDNVVTPLHYGKTDITVSTVDSKYSATCEVTVEASFVITSDSSNVKSIRCGDTAKYRIYFLNYKAEELPVDDVTATITENGVLEVLSCNKCDKYIELEVKAVSEGAEVIEVESDEPLAYNKFKISVYPENVDWRADKVPNYGKTDKENFRRSTFIVENYNYVYNENDNTYTVTMDVYNMAGDYPVLAAYNSFGELVDFDAADRFVGMPGDWLEFFGALGFGAVQMINGDLFTYKSVTRSQKSTISVDVPADGYITISNDITVCPAAAIFNLSSLLIEIVSISCDFSDSEADKNKDVTKEFVKSLKNKVPGFKETLNKLIEKFMTKSATKMTPEYLTSFLLFSKDAIYELCEDAGSSFEKIAGDVILSVLDKDIQGFISKTAMETLINKGITDAVSLSQLKAADKYFLAGKVLGLADFAIHTGLFNNGSGLTTIQFNPCGENGFVCKDTIKITSTIIDEDTLLHHFVIMDPNKKTLAKEELKINFNDIVEVHEIALIKNGKKIEDVMFRATVEMDIPKNMFGPSVKVFRIEKDGTYTQLETTIMNGKVVFTTDHFSEYILTGMSIDDVVTGVSLNTDTYEIVNKQTCQLTASISPDTASNKSVMWSSDNEEVAIVDENGLVTANSPGTAIITAKTVDGGYSASCKVTVLPREFTVTWNIDGVETSTTVSEGSAIIKPEKPTKDGYKFMDWTPAVPDAMPAYDLTFTAVFEKSYICPDCGNEILGEAEINAHITAEARMKATVKIRNNIGSNTIKYGETLCLTAVTTNMPADATIVWYIDGVKKGEGETFNVTFESGTKTVEVKLMDSKGGVLKNSIGNEISDSETVTVKSGFFQKLISFFKNLLGINRTIVQSNFMLNRGGT